MDLARNVEGFFHDEVGRAFRDEGLSPGTMVEHYIVQLLASYAAHRIEETPLALRMLAANEAPLPERRRQLRDIGDTSLYLSGFWSEHLAGGPVDVDYYIGMGGSAYGERRAGAPAGRAIHSATCSASWPRTSSASSARWRWSAGGWRSRRATRTSCGSIGSGGRPRVSPRLRGWRRWVW